jgi:hypothetical protein
LGKLREELGNNDIQNSALVKDLRNSISELRKEISQKNIRE